LSDCSKSMKKICVVEDLHANALKWSHSEISFTHSEVKTNLVQCNEQHNMKALTSVKVVRKHCTIKVRN